MDDPKKTKPFSDAVTQKLSSKLSDLANKEKENEIEKKATAIGLSYINLDKFPISQDALKLISEEQAEALQTICFLFTGEEIRLASLNPGNPQVSNLAKELGDNHHARVKVYMISENSLALAAKIYAKIPTIIHLEGINITEEALAKFDEKLTNFDSLQNLVKETSLTEAINLVIAAGLKFLASDIHIEAEENDVKVRFRIDGALYNALSMPKEANEKIGSRIKLLAGLKLNTGNKPQDGRFSITLTSDKVDVRVSIIPSAYGESIVMRLLRASSAGLQFDELGLKGKAYNDLAKQMTKPNGMLIATGPTGSGKTTTLYAILNKLNRPETKIITLEDPIEYKLPGIIQSQVESKSSTDNKSENEKNTRYTFARGLRAILRQDPDIVMVGEIRDLETADVAINAALTGHLMLSSMHTNSAAATIPRLLAMGVQSFLLAPSLDAIIGQRLVRRLCPYCKIEDNTIDTTTTTEVLNTLSTIAPESGHSVADINNLKFFQAKGCDKCHNLGYKGRVGIYEIFMMTPEIEKLILAGNVSEYEIEKIAVKNGMITMLQDGLLKALEGLTSVQEVFGKVKD
jgi:type II secretory ATPase GspE/PulE/Tfp pilus assembly ATPase PilB-like protein